MLSLAEMVDLLVEVVLPLVDRRTEAVVVTRGKAQMMIGQGVTKIAKS